MAMYYYASKLSAIACGTRCKHTTIPSQHQHHLNQHQSSHHLLQQKQQQGQVQGHQRRQQHLARGGRNHAMNKQNKNKHQHADVPDNRLDGSDGVGDEEEEEEQDDDHDYERNDEDNGSDEVSDWQMGDRARDNL